MLKGVWSFVAGLFTNDKATDTFIDIVRHNTGVNELTTKDAANLMLEHQKVTKHQSPTRRFIAVASTLSMFLMVIIWALIRSIEYLYVFVQTDTETMATVVATSNIAKIAAQPLTMFANNIITMMEMLKEPYMIIVGFYFLSHLIKK